MPAIQSNYSGVRANLQEPVVQIYLYKGNFIPDFNKNHQLELEAIAGLSSLEEVIAHSMDMVEEEIHRLVDEGVIEDPGETPVKFEFVANKLPVQN